MAEASKKGNIFSRAGARIKKFFRELRSELKKVVWPSPRTILNNTLIVLLCVVLVGVFVWAFDAIAGLIVNGIIGLVRG